MAGPAPAAGACRDVRRDRVHPGAGAPVAARALRCRFWVSLPDPAQVVLFRVRLLNREGEPEARSARPSPLVDHVEDLLAGVRAAAQQPARPSPEADAGAEASSCEAGPRTQEDSPEGSPSAQQLSLELAAAAGVEPNGGGEPRSHLQVLSCHGRRRVAEACAGRAGAAREGARRLHQQARSECLGVLIWPRYRSLA